VSVKYPTLFTTMKEAKSELSAQRAARKIVKKVYRITQPLIRTMNSMQAILRQGFKPSIMLVVKRMAPELNAIYAALNDGAIIVVQFFKKTAGVDMVEAPANLGSLVKKLDKKFSKIRLELMHSHQLHEHYPSMIRFHSYLSVLRDFSFHWQKLIETLHKSSAKEGYAALSPKSATNETPIDEIA